MASKRKMTTEFSNVSFKDVVISENEKPTWRKGEFLRKIDEFEIKPKDIVGPVLIPPELHINQNGKLSFKEFEEGEIIRKTGYHAEVMRSHGCGITSVYMALSALAGREFVSRFGTVGEFAIEVLGLHKNDRVEGKERVVGTPVFNIRSGWYHDALVYVAIHFSGVSGFRLEGISGLEKVAGQMKKLLDEGKETLVVISVSNGFWRLPTEPESVATHMVVVNGFKFDENGGLAEICVTDPYVVGKPKINQWIGVDDRIRKAFTGRALFFYK